MSTAPSVQDPARFRSLMARWATGVAVVTAHAGTEDAGLTVNALLSVSLTPPSLLVSLAHDADTLPVLERSGHFGVTFLASGQRPLSERFALPLPSVEKFQGIRLHRGPRGSPLLDGGIGAVECRVASRQPVYDHVLVVGEVVYDEAGVDGMPLLFFRSGYSESEGPERVRLPPPRV